jgi:predicted amidohydrolase
MLASDNTLPPPGVIGGALIVSSLQLSARNESKATALEQVIALLDQAKGSDLALLPELWPCGYFSFDRYASDSEPVDGPLVRALRDRARQHKFHLFTGSFVEQDGGRLYNTCLLLDPQGEILGRYRKIHLFGYDSEERRRLTPGQEVVVVPTPWGKAGLATCYDIRFPELFRGMVDQGAELFLITSAWPAQREDAWMLFNRARAHENLAHLFSCNFADDGEPRLAGHSLFVDPLGVILADAGKEPAVLTREVDMTRTEAIRRQFPALDDRVLKATALNKKSYTGPPRQIATLRGVRNGGEGPKKTT